MPNHIHGIIEITTVGADSISAPFDIRAEMDSAPTRAIPKIVQSFKRHTTIEYIKMVKQNIAPPFEKRIWQRNYYEHIIRNEKSYYQIAEYIRNNPLKWLEDKYYV
jgi:putative transposase